MSFASKALFVLTFASLYDFLPAVLALADLPLLSRTRFIRDKRLNIVEDIDSPKV